MSESDYTTRPYKTVNYSVVSVFDRIDKTAYFAAQGVLVAISMLLNAAVIGLIVYLIIKRREVWQRSPRFLPMLACCVTQLGIAVWNSIVLHNERLRLPGQFLPYTCDERLVLTITGFIVHTLPTLLVAAIVVAEAVRLQKHMTLTWSTQRAVSWAMIALGVLYVLVVLVPVFFTTQLEDTANPCVDGDYFIKYKNDRSKLKIFPNFTYTIPHLYVIFSCGLLVVAAGTVHGGIQRHFYTTNVYSRFGEGFTQTAEMTVIPNDMLRGDDARVEDRNAHLNTAPDNSDSSTQPVPATIDEGNVALSPVDDTEDNPITTNMPSPPLPGASPLSSATTLSSPPTATDTSDQCFPFNVLLAAVSCVVFNFVEFYSAISFNYSDDLRLGASILVMLTGLSVPAAWLLDAHLRPLWCCCGSRK